VKFFHHHILLRISCRYSGKLVVTSYGIYIFYFSKHCVLVFDSKMPDSVCCVTSCGRKYSKKKGNNPRFFGIPTVLEYLPDVTKDVDHSGLKD